MGKAAGHDPFVFVGHPRDGILGYFDQFGFDPFERVVDFLVRKLEEPVTRFARHS